MQIKFILKNKNSKLNNIHYKMNVFKKKTITQGFNDGINLSALDSV